MLIKTSNAVHENVAFSLLYALLKHAFQLIRVPDSYEKTLFFIIYWASFLCPYVFLFLVDVHKSTSSYKVRFFSIQNSTRAENPLRQLRCVPSTVDPCLSDTLCMKVPVRVTCLFLCISQCLLCAFSPLSVSPYISKRCHLLSPSILSCHLAHVFRPSLNTDCPVSCCHRFLIVMFRTYKRIHGRIKLRFPFSSVLGIGELLSCAAKE